MSSDTQKAARREQLRMLKAFQDVLLVQFEGLIESEGIKSGELFEAKMAMRAAQVKIREYLIITEDQ